MIAVDMVQDAYETAHKAVIEQIDATNEALAERLKEPPEGEIYHCTAYAYTGSPCANGNYPTVGKTIACNSLPMGTKVLIEGVGVRVVEDRGASWHQDNWLDIYMGDVESCMQWGNQERMVVVLSCSYSE